MSLRRLLVVAAGATLALALLLLVWAGVSWAAIRHARQEVASASQLLQTAMELDLLGEEIDDPNTNHGRVREQSAWLLAQARATVAQGDFPADVHASLSLRLDRLERSFRHLDVGPDAAGYLRARTLVMNARGLVAQATQRQTVAFGVHRSVVQRTLAICLAVAGLVAVGLVLLIVVLRRRVFVPIAGLQTAAQRVAGGDLACRVEPVARDEVGELAAAFNGMVLSLREAGARLEGTMGDLRRKTEEVEAFVYAVSHDLRGPLVNLQGFAGELSLGLARLRGHLLALPEPERREAMTIIDQDVQECLRFVEASAAKSEHLIESLLRLSRTGRDVLAAVPVDVAHVVEETLRSLQQMISEAGAAVQVGPLPACRGDATALGRIVANLVGNAVKYRDRSRPARIAIDGSVDGDQVTYRVEDNGVGIPPEAMPRLFVPFQRFHPKLAAGDGLGLPIVKRLVERMGGRLGVAPVAGGGTRFTWTLPAVAPQRGSTTAPYGPDGPPG